MGIKEEVRLANESLRKALMPGMKGINEPTFQIPVMSPEEQRDALLSIEAGANPNLRIIRNGPVALCCACAMGADLVVKALIEKGARLEDRVRPSDSKSETGYTALGLAVEKRLPTIALDLCKAGADPMELMPTFSNRSDEDAPIVWTMIFNGITEALIAGSPKTDWTRKVPGPGMSSEARISLMTLASVLSSEARISLMTLASVLSPDALLAMVKEGLPLPRDFEGELTEMGHDKERIGLIMGLFARAEREALESFPGIAAGPVAPRKNVL